MSLPALSLSRPVFAIVMNILIVLFGAIGFRFLGVREYPAIDPPVVTVRTNYAGAAAEIVETQITEPLEKAINGIEGIRSISSSSNLGSSVITVEFNVGTDMEAAANDVRDKVSQTLRQLPQDIDAPPTVTKSDANSDAIISMTVRSDARNQLEVSDYAANVLLEKLQTIPGVSSVQIWGEKKFAMRLWIDPVRLQAHGLTLSDVQQALNRENVELPSGKITGRYAEMNVKTYSRLSTEEDFENLVLRAEGTRMVRLRDVAEVMLGAENEESALRERGMPMVALAIVPQPGSNHIDIADEFYRRFAQIQKNLPPDIQLDIALDQTIFVKRSVREVAETLAIAIILVVIIIYLFFRDWLIALRPLLDIPVSLTAAFFIMYLAGFSINVLTLLAIVLATGLVVDDGIVVTENIYRRIEAGMEKVRAAREGSEEIYFAVIATSVTLAVVFLPVIFMRGFVGSLFREFGVVVAGAVLVSAFVSLTLTPVLNVWLQRPVHRRSRFYEITEKYFEQLENGYRSWLRGSLQRRGATFVVLGVCVLLIAGMWKLLPRELAPLEDRSVFRLSLSAPEGASYEYTDRFVQRVVQQVMEEVPEHRIVMSVTAPGFTGSGAVNTGMVRVRLVEPEARKRSQQEIVQQLARHLSKTDEGRVFPIQDQTISTGGTARFGLPVQFVIQNLDFQKIKEVLPRFLEEAGKHPVFQGVDVNLKFNKPELQIAIDRLKVAEMGVSAADIAQAMQIALSGRRSGYFVMNGKQYPVIMQLDRPHRDEPPDLKLVSVRTRNGELVPLDNFASITETSGPPQIYHFNRYKSATVSAGLAPGKTIGDGVAAMNEIAAKVLDDTFETSLYGAARDYAESSSNTTFALILALLLIYLVLAAQFESFVDPLIIMFTVPLAFAGALLSLWMFNQSLNIFSQIGIVMLIGLVTKNGILIVEFANRLQRNGMDKTSAATEAATLRLRPILMTSLATAFGALPIALAWGSGAQSRVPLGIVVVGGVMFSLLLTLFVIPAMYTYMSQRKTEITKTPEPRAVHA
ncbi:MAG: efflux RND transporter permease subunit [Chitinophagales bacterium]|nr:efflux RND transporter permease subunit [Chitinophagales bacterium]